jgi:hypothetical protein
MNVMKDFSYFILLKSACIFVFFNVSGYLLVFFSVYLLYYSIYALAYFIL